MNYSRFCFMIMVSGWCSCSLLRQTAEKKTIQPARQEITSDKQDSSAPGSLKPYRQLINGKATTRNGLITVHKVAERYYFEIADSLLEKDLLVVNRISRGSAMGSLANGLLGYAGDYIGENVIRFSKGPRQRIFINRMSYRQFSADSSDNGMYRSVLNSSLQPIVASFDIKALGPDSLTSVIDLTDFLNGDNDIFFFDSKLKSLAGIGAVQPDKSYISTIHSYPLNTEIKTLKTYSVRENMVTYELNSSVVRLPSRPMKPRYSDERVGYFSRGYLDFDVPDGVRANNMITRWRLEPKDADIGKYLHGELVEPQKQIVFYIDPATPKKWVPYLIKGVNDWQAAFEKAGFKNAICAKEAPLNDSAWSIEDARHNVIVYKASSIQNASGPQISDPRSGEILESHINWYHNVQELLRDWYFLQAAPADPRARRMNFDDELMGELIRYVCAHEVGHTLGLQHNFVASASVPVDSLRSRQYLASNGLTPSVMDYARFNYVAQPSDGIARRDLIPRIGVYDQWAIEWGYRWYPGNRSAEEEKTLMNQLVIEKLKENKQCYYLPPNFPDARNQAEDLGDNPAKAGTYGIQNLKLLVTHLKDWTRVPNDNYSELRKMYKGIWNTYNMYLQHATSYLTKLYYNPVTVEQEGTFIQYPDRKKMLEMINFLDEQVFKTPHWLDNKEMFAMGAGGGILPIYKTQELIIHKLINGSMWNHLLFNETNLPKDSSFSYQDMLNEVEKRVFSELKTGSPVEMARRNLQKSYVAVLILAIRYSLPGDLGRLDISHIVNDQIKGLYKKLSVAAAKYKDPVSRSHLTELATRLKQCETYQKNFYTTEERGGDDTTKGNGLRQLTAENLPEMAAHYNNCWHRVNAFKY